MPGHPHAPCCASWALGVSFGAPCPSLHPWSPGCRLEGTPSPPGVHFRTPLPIVPLSVPFGAPWTPGCSSWVSPLHLRLFRPSDHVCGLLWTCSNSSMSFLCWGPQSWTQSCRWGLSRGEQRGRIPSLDLLATVSRINFLNVSPPLGGGTHWPFPALSADPLLTSPHLMLSCVC